MALRMHQKDPKSTVGLCGNNLTTVRYFTYSQEAVNHSQTVRNYITKFLLWNMISTNKNLAYYWNVDDRGTKIRLAILDTWITLGGMTNKKKFTKQLRIELQQYNLTLADLNR